MLEIICNTLSQRNIISNNKDNSIIDAKYLSKSVFNELKKSLLNQKIEFENVSSEDKKDDKYIICANFLINDLLNILNKKDKNLNYTQGFNIQKKKIHQYNLLLDNFYFLKNTKKSQIKINKYFCKLLYIKLFLNALTRDKNSCSKKNKSDGINLVNVNYHHRDKQININNNYLENICNTKNENNFIIPINTKNHQNSLFLFHNINEIDHVIRNISSLKLFNRKEYFLKSNIEPLFFQRSNNSIQLQKLINKKILLSISNKNNKAEIYLKPENLGTIYIKIHVENNEAILKFMSNHHEVRMFLDNYVPYLRDSLKKNGITLKKVNICQSLNNKDIQNTEFSFYKKILNAYKSNKMLNLYKKNTDMVKYQEIDVYI